MPTPHPNIHPALTASMVCTTTLSPSTMSGVITLAVTPPEEVMVMLPPTLLTWKAEEQ